MDYSLYAILKLFGHRYIYCDTEQAVFDARTNREEMIAAYNAILMLADPDKGGDESVQLEEREKIQRYIPKGTC